MKRRDIRRGAAPGTAAVAALVAFFLPNGLPAGVKFTGPTFLTLAQMAGLSRCS